MLLFSRQGLSDSLRHLLGSSVHVISQARILEWVALPPPGDHPNPRIEPASPAWQKDFFTTVPPGKPKMYYKNVIKMYSGILRVKLLQLCPTLCDPMDCTLPGFSIHGILQARILEWVAMLSSRGSSQPRD